MRRSTALLMLLPALVAGVQVWAKPINPFARPLEKEVVRSDTSVAAVTERPTLRGLIVAGDGSIANLNGTLLAIGESFAGYELERVDAGSATFGRNGESVTLYLEDPSMVDAQ